MTNLITYAIPGFIILPLVDVLLTAREQRDYYDARDTAGSLAMGIGNVVVGIVGKVLVVSPRPPRYQSGLSG